MASAAAEPVRMVGTDGCVFELHRVAPGVVLSRIIGDDRGGLGDQPFRTLDRELAAGKLALFVDVRDTSGPATGVREAWTSWLSEHRAELSTVRILVGSKFVTLTVEIAKQLSRTGELIKIDSAEEPFMEALATAAGRVVVLPAPRPRPVPVVTTPRRPPQGFERTVVEGGEVRLASAGCTFSYQQLRPGVLYVAIRGHDAGEFGTATLDEIAARMSALPLEVFVDTREATGATVAVNDEWMAFFIDHRARLRRVHVLVASRPVQLMISVVKHLSRTGDLIEIHDDRSLFEAAIARAAPGAKR